MPHTSLYSLSLRSILASIIVGRDVENMITEKSPSGILETQMKAPSVNEANEADEAKVLILIYMLNP